LDKDEPAKNWIEIYNPTEKPLVLSKFRPSNIRTFNVLPVNLFGKTEVKPKQYLVICANYEKFVSIWGKRDNLVVIRALKSIPENGFISIGTRGLKLSETDYLHYRNQIESSNSKISSNNEISVFSKNEKSVSLKIKKTDEGKTEYNFYETNPTPGLSNEELN